MATRPERLLLPAGVALVVLAALVAFALRPLEWDEWCSQFGQCPSPGTDAVLVLLGWIQGAGVVAVVAGVVQRVRDRPTGPRRPRIGAAPLVAAAGAASWPVTTGLVLLAGAFGLHLLVAAAVLVLLLHGRAVTALLDGRGARERTAALAGPVAAVAAAAVAGAAAFAGPRDLWSFLLVSSPVHGVVLAGAAALATVPARAAVVLAAAGAAVVGASIPEPEVPPARPPAATAAPSTVRPPPPEPAPPPGPVVAPVVADTACRAADLQLGVGLVDGAMGLRATAVTARNAGPDACWLDGVPEFVLAQGGRPLRLDVSVGDVGGSTPAAVERVGLAPGGTASVLLTWRAHGGWADSTTPQTVTLTPVAGEAAVDVPLDGAPIDVIDDARMGVTGWRPPG